MRPPVVWDIGRLPIIGTALATVATRLNGSRCRQMDQKTVHCNTMGKTANIPTFNSGYNTLIYRSTHIFSTYTSRPIRKFSFHHIDAGKFGRPPSEKNSDIYHFRFGILLTGGYLACPRFFSFVITLKKTTTKIINYKQE